MPRPKSGRVARPRMRLRSSARPKPIGVPVSGFTTRSPKADMPGEVPRTPSTIAKTRPTSSSAPTISRTPGQHLVVAEEPPPRRHAGHADQGPADRAVEGERVEAPLERRHRGGLGCDGVIGWPGDQRFVTRIVTPSPRSMTAPGSSCTAMPGCRSSSASPGWVSTVPLVEPRSVTTALPWSAPEPGTDLEVGRGDLLVRAGHGDQSGLVGRGEAARLRRPADQRPPGRRRRSRRWRTPAGRPRGR